MWFRHVKAPNRDELTRLTHTIAQRVGRYLERQGLVERDTGNVYLTPEAVFAPNNKYRALVTPAKRGRGKTLKALNDQTPAEKRASMTWAKRLKRVFDIDIETCSECGGDVKIAVPALPCTSLPV